MCCHLKVCVLLWWDVWSLETTLWQWWIKIFKECNPYGLMDTHLGYRYPYGEHVPIWDNRYKYYKRLMCCHLKVCVRLWWDVWSLETTLWQWWITIFKECNPYGLQVPIWVTGTYLGYRYPFDYWYPFGLQVPNWVTGTRTGNTCPYGNTGTNMWSI